MCKLMLRYSIKCCKNVSSWCPMLANWILLYSGNPGMLFDLDISWCLQGVEFALWDCHTSTWMSLFVSLYSGPLSPSPPLWCESAQVSVHKNPNKCFWFSASALESCKFISLPTKKTQMCEGFQWCKRTFILRGYLPSD